MQIYMYAHTQMCVRVHRRSCTLVPDEIFAIKLDSTFRETSLTLFINTRVACPGFYSGRNESARTIEEILTFLSVSSEVTVYNPGIAFVAVTRFFCKYTHTL